MVATNIFSTGRGKKLQGWEAGGQNVCEWGCQLLSHVRVVLVPHACAHILWVYVTLPCPASPLTRGHLPTCAEGQEAAKATPVTLELTTDQKGQRPRPAAPPGNPAVWCGRR